MFTGLVQALGTVQAIENEPPGKRLVIETSQLSADAELGASIAVNGCCLTVVRQEKDRLSFQTGPETLELTNLGRLRAGSRVNLEPSLRVGDRLGGHYVTGHIEGQATLVARSDDREWSHFRFAFPPSLGRYLVAKGSVAVDGVSLTVVEVAGDQFSVMLVPHTLAATTLGQLHAGDQVNLETDLLAKYAQKQLG